VDESAGPERRRESAPETWVRLAWTYGFVLLFALIALGYGLWFGQQLIETQRQGVDAITRIEVYEEQQTQQLNEINARLERIERGLSGQVGPPGH